MTLRQIHIKITKDYINKFKKVITNYKKCYRLKTTHFNPDKEHHSQYMNIYF